MRDGAVNLEMGHERIVSNTHPDFRSFSTNDGGAPKYAFQQSLAVLRQRRWNHPSTLLFFPASSTSRGFKLKHQYTGDALRGHGYN